MSDVSFFLNEEVVQSKMEDVPEPIDKRIELIQVPAQTYATIRFSGFWDNQKKREKYGQELAQWLEKQTDYQVISPPAFAGYDPPWTIPFLRRNEVLVEIKKN